MKKSGLFVALGVVAVSVLVVAAGAADKPVHKYMGVAKCKMCHGPSTGDQYKIWAASPHANAFKTLATPAALEAGKKAGVTEPQKSEKCLKCHVTGFGEPAANFSVPSKPEDGVTCESCHGAGSDYWSMATMKGLKAGTVKAADVGLVMPTKEVCVKCHNSESPTFKSFDFDAAAKKIAHPIPVKK